MEVIKGTLASGKHMWPYFSITFTLMLVLIAQSIPYSQQQTLMSKNDLHSSSSTSKLSHGNPTSKLKFCDTPIRKLNSTIEIPTFSINEFTYTLKNYEIIGSMKSCPNGEQPTSHNVTILAKSDYDEEIGNQEPDLAFIFTIILRSVPILLNNGYLSVGDGNIITAYYYSPEEFCISAVNGEGPLTTVDFRTCPISKSRPIFSKCCPVGMILGNDSCVYRTNVKKWDPGYLDAKTWKLLSIDEANPIYRSPQLPCDEDSWEVWEIDHCTHEFHPVTDNTIAFIGAYRNLEFLSSSVDWCMDGLIENGIERMIMFHCVGNTTSPVDGAKDQARISLIYMINMYIGAIFHLMTTLVYLITWPKQNIHGKTLCSCTASLFFMQIFLGTAHLLGRIQNQRNTIVCKVNGIGGQYFIIAAFTWLLVVNYDLWRTFRSMRNETGKRSKRFLVYSSFGWLFPFIISATSVSLDFAFKCRASLVPIPEFGEYYCFVAPWSQGLYVYYILGVLIALSCLLAVLTLTSLYSFKKDTANLRSNKRAEDKQNVLLFLKLSVVMGFTWIFEVISWAATKENENRIWWIILDLYNALSAILIFIIFVCKLSTLSLLEQSVPYLKGLTAAMTKLSSTFTGETSVDSSNTASTSANGGVHKKSSIDSQSGVVGVRYMKETQDEDGGTGNAKVTLERSSSR